MEDSPPQPTDDEDFLASFTPPGSTREFALGRRWGSFATRTVRRQIFELLSQHPDHQMFLAEIARALEKDSEWICQEIRHFVWTRIVEVERRSTRTYYRLRPGMIAQYQQWLDSQKSNEPEP